MLQQCFQQFLGRRGNINIISQLSQIRFICPRRALLDYGVNLTGLPTGQVGYSRTSLLIQRNQPITPLLHISRLSPVDMLIFTLHQELLQSAFSIWSIPTYNAHTDFTYTLAGLYHVKSTLFICSCIYVRSPQERIIDWLPRVTSGGRHR